MINKDDVLAILNDAVSKVNSLVDVSSPDVAALQAQLDAANVALKAESDLDAADAAKAVALQAKIDAALAALAPAV